MNHRLRPAVALAACAMLCSTAWADTVRISGATTVLNVAVNPTRAAVEKSSGHTLQVAGSNSGKITNWKEVGGKDLPIVVYSDATTGGTRAMAGVGKGFVEAGKMKIVETKKIERPLGFVTVGAPTPASKAVIDAFSKEAKAL